MSAHIDASIENKFPDFVTIRRIRNPIALQGLEQATTSRVEALTATGHDCDFLYIALGALQKNKVVCSQEV